MAHQVQSSQAPTLNYKKRKFFNLYVNNYNITNITSIENSVIHSCDNLGSEPNLLIF